MQKRSEWNGGHHSKMEGVLFSLLVSPFVVRRLSSSHDEVSCIKERIKCVSKGKKEKKMES
jgi:hypothetical protein